MTLSRFQIKAAANAIKNLGVISYPTESVFGLGCLPLCEAAVTKILTLKCRAVEKGLILVASSLDQLEPFAILSDHEKQKILEQKTPTTWLVKKSALTPNWISGKYNKVAIRLSTHPVVVALCNEINGAIVSTSANVSAAKAAKTILQVRQYFPYELDFYLPGKLGNVGTATPIIDIETLISIR